MSDKILIAESEQTIATFLKKIIEYDKSNDLEAVIANDSKSFMGLLKSNEFAAIIIDMAFGNINVFDFISKYSTAKPLVPIITMSANIDINVALTALRTGAYDFVSKPFTAETMLLVVKNACEKRQLLIDKDQLNNDIQTVNDELTNANVIITEQKEKINKSLNNVLTEIERIKEISVALSVVKSTETTVNTIYEYVLKLYSPNSCAIMTYDEKLKSFIVKKQKEFDKEFPLGTSVSMSHFKQLVEKGKVSVEDSVKHNPDSRTVFIPLTMGRMVLGMIIMDIKGSLCTEYTGEFMDMLQHLTAISIINSKFLEESRRSYLESLIAFLMLEEKIHTGIKHHSEVVSSISLKIAKMKGMSEDDMRNVQYAALLHLLGLTAVPSEKFTKENYFSEGKSSLIKDAIISGSDILSPIVYLENAQKIISSIYENYDGTGMKEGLSGEKIPMGSRIIRVVGEYMAFANIFKMQRSEINAIMNEGSGKLYDPEIVSLMLEISKKN